MLGSLKGHAEIVEILLKHGANRTAKNNAGKTALDVAKEFGQEKIVRFLELR